MSQAAARARSGGDAGPRARIGSEADGARPLMGNEAIARGAWEAGVRVAAAYPGTPSTEILESLARFPAGDVHAQWSTNEKVALDVAIGASFGGARALAAMKHVGLNVAADSFMSVSYIGVHGGLVLAVCDDPGIHSSQNEQDTRLLGRMAMVPVLEPADAQEALELTRRAFALSEAYDTPVIVRSTTRLSHTRSPVRLGEREEHEPLGFLERPGKNVMIPAYARQRHPAVLERIERFREALPESGLTRWERGETRFGVITLGTPYHYVKEVLPEASVLKLGCSYPLDEATARAFCASVERVLVVEELEPVVEEALRGLGLEVEGKRYFPRTGELSPETVRGGFEAAGALEPATRPALLQSEPLLRPPVLCAGCPHSSTYMAMRALDARVTGDIGCYTLAAIEPLEAIDTCVAMGASIGNAIGLARAGVESRPIVATIGDSTFLHAGIPALIDAVYNQVDITVIILDNHIVAMTGGQDHPGTGRTLRGEPTHRVDLEQMVRACGVEWVRTVDSYDLARVYQTYREATEHRGVAVVISNRPCVLDPVKVKGPPFTVREGDCVACQACMNLGCPALLWSETMHEGHHKVRIDEAACMGCSLCMQVCPSDAIAPAQPARPAAPGPAAAGAGVLRSSEPGTVGE